jgi:hypothetical protein
LADGNDARISPHPPLHLGRDPGAGESPQSCFLHEEGLRPVAWEAEVFGESARALYAANAVTVITGASVANWQNDSTTIFGHLRFFKMWLSGQK